MKQSLLQFTRTGVLGLALAGFAAIPGAADSVRVVNAAEDETAEQKAKLKAVENAPAAPTAPEAPAMDGAPGEVKQQLPATIPELSPGLAEIVRLAQAKVGEDVLLAYVERSTHAYNPSTEEIIYLHDLGVSDKVIAELVKRSPNPEKMAEAKAAVTKEPLNIPEVKAPTAPALTPLVSTNPAPATEVVVQQQPVVVQQPVIVQQPVVIQQAPADVQYFYSSLSPYGSWVDVDGYGWCWQPTVAVTYVGWRPYQHGGRWLYTDSGWYWQSDYSWGWAPFHYGRWFNHPRRGWCWTPDRVWGPAWVSWRNSSSYCGWAPLPPAARYHSGIGFTYRNSHVGVSFEFGLGASDYVFVGHNHFYSHNPYRHCVPATQVTRVYNQTVVNNVIVQGNNNNVVINQGGAPVTQISKATRTEIQKVSVRETPAAQRASVQPDRVVRDGGSLAVYRPSGPSEAPRTRTEVSKSDASGISGRPSGSRVPVNQAPANLQPQLGTVSSGNSRATAPNTALQRYEAPKPTALPKLTRPQTQTVGTQGTEPSRSLGTPTHPAGTGIDRAPSPQRPVEPARPTATRGMGYTSPGFRTVEPSRPISTPEPVRGPTVTPSAPQPVNGPAVTLSQPKPVSGSPAIPSAGRPVTPATPEQVRTTPQTPVSSYQAPPTAAQRFEPTRPSTSVIQKPGGYTQRPSVQPTYGNNNNNSSVSTLPRTETPRNRELPRTELPRSYSPPSGSYAAPSYSQPSTPGYTAPSTPSYTPPSQSQRPERNNTPSPGRSYEAPRPSYSAPAAPRPSYTPPAASPAPRQSAPQQVTLPRSSVPSSPAPSSGGGGSRPSPGRDNNNGRPGR
ncbi:MAG TPA: DUF6600 domain-containing protein [Verrucomicrobiae bacterium]